MARVRGGLRGVGDGESSAAAFAMYVSASLLDELGELEVELELGFVFFVLDIVGGRGVVGRFGMAAGDCTRGAGQGSSRSATWLTRMLHRGIRECEKET